MEQQAEGRCWRTRVGAATSEIGAPEDTALDAHAVAGGLPHLDLQDIFEPCDGVLLSLTSGRIDVAAVPRLKALFDEHRIA